MIQNYRQTDTKLQTHRFKFKLDMHENTVRRTGGLFAILSIKCQ